MNTSANVIAGLIVVAVAPIVVWIANRIRSDPAFQATGLSADERDILVAMFTSNDYLYFCRSSSGSQVVTKGKNWGVDNEEEGIRIRMAAKSLMVKGYLEPFRSNTEAWQFTPKGHRLGKCISETLAGATTRT